MTTSSAPRPPLPALGLPRPPRRLGPSAVIALIVHVIVIGAVIWERTQYLQGTGRGEGPPGGGGGGGEETQYVALAQAAEAPKQEAAPPPPVEEPVPVAEPIKVPEPEIEIAPISIAPVAPAIVGIGTGTGGGPGEESGSGGGTGGGSGTGTGSNDGPGTGGDGSYIQPAVLRGLIIAPDCVRGHLTVQFSVSAEGKVAGVDVDPLPKDAGCRRDLVTRMRQYKFSPAKNRDGRAVASTYTVKIEH